jgi:glycosyltransferase involved in cell wall biosynthesis
MAFQPKMAFGIPIYNHAHQIERTIESILTQSFDDFAVVAVDDGSSDDSVAILERYATNDPRLRITRNEQRLGYTRNAAKSYSLSRELFPSIEYFAWGSDHDLWHPHWLRLLTDQLEAEPDASLAWTWRHVLTADGKIVRSQTDAFKGGDSRDRRRRLVFAAKEAAAGSILQGLLRVAALEKTSGLRRVLAPDRLLVAELALVGRFVLVPEFLWHRRYFGLVSGARQRRNSFPEGAPLHTYLPPTLQHSCALFYDFVLSRRGGLSLRESNTITYDFLMARWALRREQSERAREARAELRRRRLKKRKKEIRSQRRAVRRAIYGRARAVYQGVRKIIVDRLPSSWT